MSRAIPLGQQRRSNISPALVCVAPNGNCHRAYNGSGSLKTALGWTVSSGQFSPRVANSAEQITEVRQLTRPPVRFLRHPWRLLRARGRFRRSENQGDSAQMAWSLNHIATADLRAARMKKYNRANTTGHGPVTALGWFECFELVGVFSGRVTKSRGKLTEAALPTWHPVQFFCCCRYFFRLHAHFRRKNNLGNNARLALRADFWSATGPVPMCGQLRRENNNGDAAVKPTSLI